MTDGCDSCDLEPGQTAWIQDTNDLTCDACGYAVSARLIELVYLGKVDNEHFFKLAQETVCAECKAQKTHLIRPCGGGYSIMLPVWRLEEVEVK